MKKLYSIYVRGKTKEWSFNFWDDEENLKDCMNDGLKIDRVKNRIPMWAQELGLTKIWFWLQDHWIIPLE
jgi:hypothetical protein